MAQRRDVRREVSIRPLGDDPGAAFEAFARDAEPSAALLLAELVEGLMGDLEPRERQMLTLSLQGYTAREIGAQVGRTERTVGRLLEKVRKRLERQRAEDAGSSG